MEYLGHLPKTDPLYQYLKEEIMPQIGVNNLDTVRVFGSKSSHAVYIYEDKISCKRVVGKFFAVGESDIEKAKRKLHREYNNICEFKKYLGNFHYVARPLGIKEELDCLLVIEYCYGTALDAVIKEAINNKNESYLFDKLSALGNFLSTIHNNSAQSNKVNFQSICLYFENIIKQLDGILYPGEADYFYNLCQRYKDNPNMYQDNEVLVHGDATPSNFFFGDDQHVITFDLERMHRSDRMFDTGRIAGEIQHFFLVNTSNKYLAEPFIGHFLWQYCKNFPDQQRAFESITSRLPFYMGMTLLRIARNTYLTNDYRRKLIEEAKLTLDK